MLHSDYPLLHVSTLTFLDFQKAFACGQESSTYHYFIIIFQEALKEFQIVLKASQW